MKYQSSGVLLDQQCTSFQKTEHVHVVTVTLPFTAIKIYCAYNFVKMAVVDDLKSSV
jgi:hypothetical protein